MKNINVICALWDGHSECPFLFAGEDEAGKCFESIVKKEKFREKQESESWDNYAQSFYTWYESDDYPSDRMTFEIHWYINVELIEGQSDSDSVKKNVNASTDEIAIIWHLDDVKGRAKENDIDLDDDLARQVLKLMESRHNCNYGITWDTIDSYINEVINLDFSRMKAVYSKYVTDDENIDADVLKALMKENKIDSIRVEYDDIDDDGDDDSDGPNVKIDTTTIPALPKSQTRDNIYNMAEVLTSLNVERPYYGGPGAVTFTINVNDKLIMSLDPKYHYGSSILEVEF